MGRNKQFALLFQNGEGCGKKRLPQITAAGGVDDCVLTHLFCEREEFLTLLGKTARVLVSLFLGRQKEELVFSVCCLSLKKKKKEMIFGFDRVGCIDIEMIFV